MTIVEIENVVRETKRFLKLADIAKKRLKEDSSMSFGCSETGDLRRASMDLTKALVRLRHPYRKRGYENG